MLTSMFLCSVEQQLTNGAAQHFICNSSTPQISLDTSQQQTINSIIQMQPVSAGTQTAESAMVGILIPPHPQGVSWKLCVSLVLPYFSLHAPPASPPPPIPPPLHPPKKCVLLVSSYFLHYDHLELNLHRKWTSFFWLTSVQKQVIQGVERLFYESDILKTTTFFPVHSKPVLRSFEGSLTDFILHLPL